MAVFLGTDKTATKEKKKENNAKIPKPGIHPLDPLDPLDQETMFRDETFEASEHSLFNDQRAISAFQRAKAGEDVPEASSSLATSAKTPAEVQASFAARAGVDGASLEWMRPTDTYPESKEGLQAPALFIDGDDAGDVVQGDCLEDAWLLGALGAIAAHPLALVQNLFVEDDDNSLLGGGFVTCRFYIEGEWQEVRVDTRIPTREYSQEKGIQRVAAYGRCRNAEEQWVQLVEKAYAKLYGGNYGSLNGGSVADALTDLTGGSSQTIIFPSKEVSTMIENGQLWNRVQKYLSWYYVLACSKTTSTTSETKAGETEPSSGLLISRAYSILAAKEIGALRFVKIRNPWGISGDWKGEWSDESPKWDEHPEVEQAMKEDDSIGFDRLIRDGTFWMVWEDYVRQFDTIHMCRLFGEEFNQYLIQGTWKGASAGGAHKSILNEREAAKKKGKSHNKKDNAANGRNIVLLPIKPDKRRGTYVQQDGDAKWFNNPQYRITVEKDTEVYITLMQRDRRLTGPTTGGGGGVGGVGGDDGGGGVGGDEGGSKSDEDGGGSGGSMQQPVHYFSDFTLLRCKRNDRRRVWEHIPERLICHGTSSHLKSDLPQREVAKASIQMSPKYAYILIPYTMKWGVELPYTVRIFTTGECAVEALPELYNRTFEGSWDTDAEMVITAGGPIRSKNSKTSNPRWTQNPQYLLRIPKQNGPDGDPISFKVVIQRTDKTNMNKGKREGSRNFSSLTIVKPNPPHTDGKKRRAALTNFMGEPLSPSKKKHQHESKEGTKTDVVDFGRATDVSRKFSVTKQEWCVCSEGTDRETATILLKDVRQSWCENGLMIVPTLMGVDIQGSYVLQVFSDQPVHLTEMPQSQIRTIPGSWTENASGGCHMNTDWKRNPKFSLKLNCDQAAAVKITLTRPEDRWKKKCAKDDAVDCMMGFYLVAGTRVTKEPTGIYHEGQPYNFSGTVPIHEISTPGNFYLEPLPNDEVYTIMPVTYGSGKTGPFFVTVETDVDFLFTGK